MAVVAFGPLLGGGMPGGMNFILGYFIYVLPGLLFVYGLVYLAGRMGEEREEAARARKEAELANLQLRDYAQQVEELAILRERNRLARDVHDTIAHGFTGIIMQLEAVTMMMQRDPAMAANALAAVEDQARDSLAEVRRSVHALRPLKMETARGLAAIEKLVEEFQTTTGITADVIIAGVPVELSTAQELCMYRTVQEGLSNAFRHGRATRTRVRLTYASQQVVLGVEDDGRGAAGPLKEGLGIVGMRERADVLGGRIQAGEGSTGGFVLQLTLPIHAEVGGIA